MTAGSLAQAFERLVEPWFLNRVYGHSICEDAYTFSTLDIVQGDFGDINGIMHALGHPTFRFRLGLLFILTYRPRIILDVIVTLKLD